MRKNSTRKLRKLEDLVAIANVTTDQTAMFHLYTKFQNLFIINGMTIEVNKQDLLSMSFGSPVEFVAV